MIAKLERITADVLEAPVEELAEAVKTAEAANIDETSWWQGRDKAWLWVVVTRLGIVFRSPAPGAARSPGTCSARSPSRSSSATGSRATSGSSESRQVCWAHLRRDFQAMIDRGGDGAEVGRRLLGQSDELFEWWHQVRDGTMPRSTFLQTVAWLRPMVRASLERGSACACPRRRRRAASCCGVGRLWTFVRVEGVEPTNNDAERALRHAVI